MRVGHEVRSVDSAADAVHAVQSGGLTIEGHLHFQL
jgi:hypothetical protein